MGWAPPMGVSQCQLLPLQGHLRELVAKGEGGHGTSVCLSVGSSRKQAKSSGNGSVLPRSSGRLKETFFFVGPWGKHSMTDHGGEWGHPAACIKALSGCILLTSHDLDSHCWGCRQSLLKEQYYCSSLQSGCNGLGNGEVCLWGLLEAQEGGLWAIWQWTLLLHSTSTVSAMRP